MNTEQKIPDEIKKQIEDELDNYLERLRISSSSIDKMRDVHRSLGFKTGAEFGYSLGIAGRSAGLERIAELEKELRKYLAYEPERDSKFHLTVLKRDTNNLLK